MIVRVADMGSTRPVASVHVNVMGKTPALGEGDGSRVLHGRRWCNATKIPGEVKVRPPQHRYSSLKRDRIEVNDRVCPRRVNDTAGRDVRRRTERLSEASKASTTPYPKLLSTPGVPRSTAATRKDVGDACITDSPRTTGSFNEQRLPRQHAEPRQTCQRTGKICQEVLTPSAAATSGLVRTSWTGKKSHTVLAN